MFNTEIYKKQMAARSPALVALETIVMVTITVTALLGNLMVCWAVYRSKKLRTVPNLYIIALAIFDILMAILCMPLSVEVFITANFAHGENAVQFQGFFSFFLSLASLQTMTAMAINRFYRIVKPVLFRKYLQSLQSTVLSLVMIVVLATFGACLPLIFGFAKYTFHYGKVFSYIDYSTPLAAYIYTIFLKICYITIPTLITLFCYYRIFATVKNHTKELMANQRNNSGSTGGGLSMNVEDVNITKALFATVLGFVACWTPVAVVDMIDTFSNHALNNPREVYLFYIYMGYGSSSINPFIYGILNRSFKREFIKIFRLHFSKRFSNETELSNSANKVAPMLLLFVRPANANDFVRNNSDANK
ncbi:melatonin receptor type 1B-B-like [Actinia tenebrosa]|uniref:Melatonin receptor type 1B-B-like n=1 Tax=Actinia tenebrosa TaxID=6105 RepID=A0A6P8HPU7_ACTTE|nr:melatonin receptor type 1B-B-like [Actinia tenebrosa]